MKAKDEIAEKISAMLAGFRVSPRRDAKLVLCSDQKELTSSLSKDSILITDAWVLDNLIKPLSLPHKVFTIQSEDVREGDKILSDVKGGTPVIGFGGGRPSDIAKYVASKLGSRLTVVPTAPSNDGISSGVSALLVDGKKVTVKTKRPETVILFKPYWEKAPDFFIKAGICDLLAKLTSIQDTYLSMNRGERIDSESLFFGLKSLQLILEYKPGDFSLLANALLLSGESMKVSSRVASGSEHEVEKLLVSTGFKQLHGQLVGLGTLISARLYQDHAKELPKGLFLDNTKIYDTVRSLFSEMGLLEYALEPLTKLGPDDFNKLCGELKKVSKVRPERHTIWQAINSEKIDWPNLLKKILV